MRDIKQSVCLKFSRLIMNCTKFLRHLFPKCLSKWAFDFHKKKIGLQSCLIFRVNCISLLSGIKDGKEISKKPQELYGMSFEFRSHDNEKHSAVQYLLNLSKTYFRPEKIAIKNSDNRWNSHLIFHVGCFCQIIPTVFLKIVLRKKANVTWRLKGGFKKI